MTRPGEINRRSWLRHAALLALLALIFSTPVSGLGVSNEAFLRTCTKAFDIFPEPATKDDGALLGKAFSENLDEALSVYLAAIMNRRYYDNVAVLLFQDGPLPLVPKGSALKPLAGPLMMIPDIAARYPLAERMAFLNLVLKTAAPMDRGAYHAVAKGKERELGVLRDWVRVNGKLIDSVTQEAVRVLAGVNMATFLKEVCASTAPYQADTVDAAEQQRALAGEQLRSSDRIEQLAGLSRLFRLGIDWPATDIDGLWAAGPLATSPLNGWERENRVVRKSVQQFVSGKMATKVGETQIPGNLLLGIFQCDAWYSMFQSINPSLSSVYEALNLATGETDAQTLALAALWSVFPNGTGRPNIPKDELDTLAHFADKYVSQFRGNKNLLPACLILYFPFLRKRDGFEVQYKSAWDLYMQVVQSDSPGLRCRALVCLGWKEGRLPTPEGDMVRKAIELEMQDAAKDGDLCHIIAVTAAAENSGQRNSMMSIGPTVP